MIILGLAELFKTMNRPNPTRPNPARPGPAVTLFDGLFFGQYER